jgi:hypothetical protein
MSDLCVFVVVIIVPAVVIFMRVSAAFPTVVATAVATAAGTHRARSTPRWRARLRIIR